MYALFENQNRSLTTLTHFSYKEILIILIHMCHCNKQRCLNEISPEQLTGNHPEALKLYCSAETSPRVVKSFFCASQATDIFYSFSCS